MNTGMMLAQYPVYYQIVVTQPSSGVSNSVYKLQHLVAES